MPDSAAQAYNRHDARSAKALSLRGQAENNLMREAHRKAAQILYEEANKISDGSREIFIDLHGIQIPHISNMYLFFLTNLFSPGLHAEEAIDYLNKALRTHEKASPMRPVYAITGSGHHSRGGKDKIGKAVKAFLNEWHYVFREFSGPGDRNGMGGVIGIDPTSREHRSLERAADSGENLQGGSSGSSGESQPLAGQSTKLVILKKEV
jgi:DNA-nicking Smr family endonuclease